jgi:hypothetical protein
MVGLASTAVATHYACRVHHQRAGARIAAVHAQKHAVAVLRVPVASILIKKWQAPNLIIAKH